MATLSLKIHIDSSSQVKTMQFEPSMRVYDACECIRHKIQDANRGNSQEYGLFLADEDPKKGLWLEGKYTLEYYLLRNGDELEYKSKLRIIRVRMLDGSVKTLQVDDSQNVSQLMIAICARIGITNHEEYSLIYELPEDEREKMATLKKQSTLSRDQKKLDSMRKKLHTDDELNWLDHNKTLREQSVTEGDTLLLKRKLFFSDQNIDARDPIQLNLLYVQMRDAILNGAHPVTQDEAVQFAGFQCHIQFGPYVETKHKPGFLELKDFLPKEYVKIKNIEKRIFQEHKLLYSLNEVEAKVRYTQLARSLKTYGITFFLVKEKLKGSKKLVPRLFGINKESIIRVDEKTKEIIHTWPLTHVKRWASSANSFNLDFGDHDTQYYSVQTTEGEAISALIAGYIDIILKRKQEKDHFGLEGDEESTMLEENVTRAKATIIQHQSSNMSHASTGSVAMPGVIRNSQNGPQSFQVGSMGGAKYGSVHNQSSHQHLPPSQSSGQNSALHAGLSQSQRALLGTISSARNVLDNTHNDIDNQLDLPSLGDDAASRKWRENTYDFSKENVNSHLSAVNAATAQIINLTSSSHDETDHAAVGSAVHTISSNMQGLTRDVKMLAALRDAEGGNGRNLLDAARKMTGALSDLLNAAQPDSKQPRSALLGAATKVSEASGDIVRTVGITDDSNQAYNDMLMDLAKAVANATANLVLKAKAVSSSTEEEVLQNKVITTATQCALATSQLVSCTKISVSTINNPACQEQVIEAAKLVAKSVESVVQVGQEACNDDQLKGDLESAAQAVSKAINDLLTHIKHGGHPDDDAVDTILNATDKLFNSMGDAPEMVRQARSVAQATSTLVNAINGQAQDYTDSDIRDRLKAAAQVLAEATCKMVEAAKGCASNPNDSSQQQNLKSAAEDLRSATNAAAQNALKKKQLQKLETAVRQACSAVTQLHNASEAAASFNRNQPSQQELSAQSHAVSDQIPELRAAMREAKKNPESVQATRTIIDLSKALLQPGNKVCLAAKAAVPTIGDKAAQLSVSNATRQLGVALADLRTATIHAEEVCGGMQIEGAIEEIRALEEDLAETKKAAESSTLVPLPGESAEACSLQLGTASKSVGSAMASLLTAAAQGNEEYTYNAAVDTAHALKSLVAAIRGVAATSSDKKTNLALIEAGQDVLDKSARLLEEVNRALSDPNNRDNQTRLAQVAKAVSQSLNSCVSCLPGQRDIDNVLKSINSSQDVLNSGRFPPADGKSYAELQDSLVGSAGQLNEAAADIVTAARGTPQQLATSSHGYNRSYASFIENGLTVAGANRDQEAQQLIIGGLKGVSVVSSKLLLAAKALHSDPTAPNAKNLLAQAARNVTDSINQLIDTCTTAAPGQKECDSALREINAASKLLDTPNEPVNDNSYYQCLDTVMDKSKMLGQSMTGITNYSKDGNMESFCVSVRQFSTSICALTESAAQSAYLVGIADKASEPGKPGLVDQSQFSRANQAIQQACQTLASPTSSQSQVLSAATVIAKHTSALCNACRIASGKTNNPVAKRQFVQSAKDVANSTANLVKAIKVLDGDFGTVNKQACAEASRPLIDAVEKLTTYGSSPEFASVPARISKEARRAQEPIIAAGRQMVESSCKMVLSAKKLVSAPKDPSIYQAFSTHSKGLSQAMKSLITSIRESAPGQRESDQAIDSITSWVKDLDAAAFSAASRTLAPREDNSMQGFQEQVINSCKQIIANIDPLVNAASSEAEKLGHRITLISNYFDPLTDGGIGCASKMHNEKQQAAVLEQTKSVAEAGLELIYCAKSSAGNPKATEAHTAMGEAATSLKELAQELLGTMEEAASAGGAVTAMIDNLGKAIAKTEGDVTERPSTSFVDFQTSMVQQSRRIAQFAHEMVGKASTPETTVELGHLANLLTKEYSQLAEQLPGACKVCSSAQVGIRLKSRVQDLGNACVKLVQNAGVVQSNPTDTYSKHELADSARNISEQVSYVLAALQDSSRGTQACINAASIVSGIIGDLDTTIMFATAGTLNSENEGDSFTRHREDILRTAKTLVDNTKALVSGAASTQEALANAAQISVKTIASLADVVKLGAASIGADQPEAQVLLINAVKDVASALSELISCTKNAAGKDSSDPAMIALKDSAKVMVTNVTSLLKTVKTVEDEAQRGTRALESTIEALRQEIKAFEGTDKVDKVATAEDVIRFTKPITTATAKAVAAGNSCRQEDVIAASNTGRKAVCDLLLVCRGAVQNAENEEIKKKTLQSAKSTAETYLTLLNHINEILQNPGPNQPSLKLQMRDLSKNVAQAVSELCRSAEALKGSDFVDPDDPTVIAENELLGAAKSIEAAAKKLMQLKPRVSAKEANENLNFDEQILEACKSIAAATSALVKSATAAQRELVTQGRMSMSFNRYMPDEDGQWSQGLISAARMVAAATHSLCEAANAMVQGHASEEQLISSAKQVAGSTAQLLVACKVKADPDSVAMKRLQAAGNAVKRATEALVKAAQQVKEREDEANVQVNKKMVGGVAQLIDVQAEVLEKEKELQRAREKLAALRKEKYKHAELEDTDRMF